MKNEDNEKKRRKYWLILLLCLIIVILMLVTVSYTVGSTILNIVGTNNTQIINWDVRIMNVSTSTVGTAIVDEVDVSNTMIRDFNVVFTKPGDEVSMTFDVVNKGSLNAKLDYFNIGKMVCTYKDGRDATDYCKNIYYVVEYANGNKIEVGDTLDVGQSKKIKVTLKYYEDSVALNDIIYIDDIDISFIYGQR